jgi:hypothetical protein
MAHVTDTSETVDRCICAACPAFPEEGILFCARGRGEKPVARRGCICPDCDNYTGYELKGYYYCADGSAEETE